MPVGNTFSSPAHCRRATCRRQGVRGTCACTWKRRRPPSRRPGSPPTSSSPSSGPTTTRAAMTAGPATAAASATTAASSSTCRRWSSQLRHFYAADWSNVQQYVNLYKEEEDGHRTERERTISLSSNIQMEDLFTGTPAFAKRALKRRALEVGFCTFYVEMHTRVPVHYCTQKPINSSLFQVDIALHYFLGINYGPFCCNIFFLSILSFFSRRSKRGN